MGKIIFFLILAAVAYLLLRAMTRPKRTDSPSAKTAEGSVETMQACARCGVNLPKSEALEADGRFFCSEEHRRLGAK
ncbi:MAG: hypothetical protein HYY28_10185 [Betaproteobacteria bacterium]|nr:hypothetical protein [Betaproteobacteria bacterium]MBI2960672.1 hypothetical protein [Betaproteobacteria bacterium]